MVGKHGTGLDEGCQEKESVEVVGGMGHRGFNEKWSHGIRGLTIGGILRMEDRTGEGTSSIFK